MILQLYYALFSDFVFTIIIDSVEEVYWKASPILQILELGKNTSKVLKRHFQSVKRAKDIAAAYNNDNFMLTTQQVRILYKKVHPINWDFVVFFENVVSGRATLYTKEINRFKYYSEQFPSVAKAIPVQYYNLDSVLPKGRILSFKLPELVKKICSDSFSSNSLRHRRPDIVTLKSPPPPATTTSTDRPLLLLCPEPLSPATTLSPAAVEPPPSTSNTTTTTTTSPIPAAVAPDTTTTAIYDMKIDESRSTARPSSPETPSMPPPSPSYPPPSSSVFPLSPAAAAAADPFSMEVDESRSFMLTDPHFGVEYKFHAVKASWLSGPASVGFSSFVMPESNEHFLFVPVKKH